MNTVNNNGKVFKGLLLMLFLVQFFSFASMTTKPFLALGYVILFSSIHKKGQSFFDNIILVNLIFLLVSLAYSVLFNKEPLEASIFRYYTYFGLLGFYVLRMLSLDYEQTKRMIIIFSMLMVGAYIFQWQTYPQEWFSGITNINDYEFRMRFACTLSCYLMIFYGINEYMVYNRKWKVLLMVLGAIPVIIMGFRSLTGLTVACAILMMFFVSKRLSGYFRYAIIIMLAIWIGSQNELVQSKIEEMSVRQEDNQSFGNEDYVRVIGLAYYEDMFSENPLMRICGGGFDRQENSGSGGMSSYDNSMSNAYSLGLLWNDLGIIGYSYILGPFTVLTYLLLIIKCILMCKSPGLQFVRFALLATTLGSIMTSEEIYRKGNIIMVAMLAYMLYQFKQENPDLYPYRTFKIKWFEKFYNA